MQLISLATFNQIFNSSTMSFELVIWCMYVGCVIAAVMTLYYKRYLGDFVRAIIENEAFTPETALTLDQLGFGKNSFIKGQLRGKGVFSALVYQAGDTVVMNGESAIPVYHDRIDFSTARFFIPYQLRIRAELRFDKKGSHIMSVVIVIISLFIVALLVTTYGPAIFEWAQGIFAE